MVQSLPGFLNLCLNVCSPSQVLGDVYTEVLEAAYPLVRRRYSSVRNRGREPCFSQTNDVTVPYVPLETYTGSKIVNLILQGLDISEQNAR